jgi:hypothetical protein
LFSAYFCEFFVEIVEAEHSLGHVDQALDRRWAAHLSAERVLPQRSPRVDMPAQGPPGFEAVQLRDADHDVIGVPICGGIKEAVEESAEGGQLMVCGVRHCTATRCRGVSLKHALGNGHLRSLHGIQ